MERFRENERKRGENGCKVEVKEEGRETSGPTKWVGPSPPVSEAKPTGLKVLRRNHNRRKDRRVRNRNPWGKKSENHASSKEEGKLGNADHREEILGSLKGRSLGNGAEAAQYRSKRESFVRSQRKKSR